ncbi:MAG: sigma-70 family RNA polymerase sigma factor [Planctomycetota bacterium]
MDPTQQLLQRWHAGDASALDGLLDEHLPWISNFVHARLGQGLRTKEQTQDIVQEALLEFLRFGPRFIVGSAGQLRGLLSTIVINVLSDRRAWFTRRRRDMHREAQLQESGAVVVDPRVRSTTNPSRAAERGEVRQRIRLALELLDPLDREVVQRHHFDAETFVAIAESLATTPDAIRKRFRRALARLMRTVRDLESGTVMHHTIVGDGREVGDE